MTRFRVIRLGIVLLLMLLIVNGARAPRATDAAPLIQSPTAWCTCILPNATELGKLSVGEWLGRDSSTRVTDLLRRDCFGTYTSLDGTNNHLQIIVKQSGSVDNAKSDFAKIWQVIKDLEHGAAQFPYGDDAVQGISPPGTDSRRIYLIFRRGTFLASVGYVVSNSNLKDAQWEQMKKIATALDANLQAADKCFKAPATSPTRAVTPTATPTATIVRSLNVGIGGNFDEDNNQVSVVAGVENRPGVGIGDDYYEWSLDGAPIQKGIEQKTLQYNTASLAAGEHQIVVKVTDVNKASGTATFRFTKKKAASAAPPAQPPAGSAAAQLQLTTSAGTQTINPGVKTPIKLPPGSKAELKAQCEQKVFSLLLMAISESSLIPWPAVRDGDYFITLAILQQRLCDKLQTTAPRQIARAGYLTDSLLPLIAAPDTAVQIQIEVPEGKTQFEVTNAQVAADVMTSASTISAIGKSTFDVAYAPATNTNVVSVSQGNVNIQPQNSRLAPVTLRAGQMVTVTPSSISPVAAIPTSGDPIVGFAILGICGSASCLSVLVLFGGIVMLTRRKPKSMASPAVAPRVAGKPTDLPK